MEIATTITVCLFLIAAIIFLVGFAIKLLVQTVQVSFYPYEQDLDEELEGYINSPNRWD